jgi:hypothetical protein
MKAILLAGLATVTVLFMATLMFRLWRVELRVRALTWVFAVGLVLLSAASIVAPRDLGFLPPSLTIGSPWIDLLSALFFYAAAFFGGVLQLYNLADRGFSLRILIDLLEKDNERGSANELFSGYSHGQGMYWMYSKRVAGLVANGLATVNGDMLVLTNSGEKIARIYWRLRRFLNLDQ